MHWKAALQSGCWPRNRKKVNYNNPRYNKFLAYVQFTQDQNKFYDWN